MDSSRPWHELFGLSLIDFFRGTPVTVVLEQDLSVKKQYLDVVLIRTDTTPIHLELPDGFDALAAHNLLTFKSFQDTLDGWALNELVGHYVNYRKQASETMRDLLPETDFRLFAVSVRYPRDLAKQIALSEVSPGVYDVDHFSGKLRLIVVHELPLRENNAILHLFSAQVEMVKYGASTYRQKSEETSTLLKRLFDRYKLEVVSMADALTEFARRARKEMCEDPAERKEFLELIPIEERLDGVPLEQRLQGVPLEQRLQGVPLEELRALLAKILREEE